MSFVNFANIRNKRFIKTLIINLLIKGKFYLMKSFKKLVEENWKLFENGNKHNYKENRCK